MSKFSHWLKYRKILHGHRRWSDKEVMLWEKSRRGYVMEMEKQIFSKLLGDQKGLVLEVACGTSRFSDLFSEDEYVGLDFSCAMLKLAKKNYPNRQYVKADAFHLPFRNGVFKIVFASRFIHHYNGVIKHFFLDAKRVSNGVFLFDISRKNSLFFLAVKLSGMKGFGRNLSILRGEMDGLSLEITEYQRYFFLPSTAYSILPSRVFQALDQIGSRVLPSRCFIMTKRAQKRRGKLE